MDMLNMNDTPGQAGPQVQDQNPFSNLIVDQDQLAQLQFPLLDTAHNNNVPAMNLGIPESAIDPRLRAPKDDGSDAGPEGQANMLLLAQRLACPVGGPRYPHEQRYSLNPPIGPILENFPGQNNSLPLEVFMPSPSVSNKPAPTAGPANAVGSSSGSRSNTPLKLGHKQNSLGPTESPSKKRKASPHNRSQSLAQLQCHSPSHNHGNNNGNPAVRDKRAATVGSSMSPRGPPDQFQGHSSEPGHRVPPSGNGPVQISPATVARRERIQKALMNLDKNWKVAWQKMPGHMRFGFHKELAQAETRAEPLELWEKYLLFKNSEEDKIRVYQELAIERYREREKFMVMLSDHLEKYDGLRSEMQKLREHVFNLESTVQKNELARQKMMGRITDLERSHLELNRGLDERVHILNGKVDRKAQELEEAVEKLKMGEEGLSE